MARTTVPRMRLLDPEDVRILNEETRIRYTIQWHADRASMNAMQSRAMRHAQRARRAALQLRLVRG